jgi:predicted dehydrogenase
MTTPVRLGMVGGGPGAFIGAVHRMAAALDGQLQLVCGAFGSSPERSRSGGLALGLDPARCYADWTQMLAEEAARPAPQRMECLTIVTPNASHVPIARAALRAGFHVFCEKPVALSLAEARSLAAEVRSSGRQFALAHTYSGYALVRQARELVRSGALGALRKVIVEYLQGWLSEPLAGNKQADWRADPALAGPSGCMGDIGTHAAHLAEFVTGARIEAVSAELNRIVPGRVLDDDGAALLRFSGGLRGVLLASQIAAGEENGLALRLYGERGGLEWRQQEPNSLWLKWHGQPAQLLRAGGPATAAAAPWVRLPAGHPEGYLEAFGNLYREFAARIRALEQHPGAPLPQPAVPGIEAGVRGMAILEALLTSSHHNGRWQAVEDCA